MSGPKVFHVVTREEIAAICQRHLARVDAAVAEWMQAAQQRGAASPADIDAVRNRQHALHSLLANDHFAELQKQAPLEVSFLQSDAHARRDKAAAAEVEARQARRRAGRTAEMLLQQLDKAERAIPDDLRRAVRSGDPSEVSTAIHRAFQLLSDIPTTSGATEKQRTLAEKLGRGEARMTLAQWLDQQPTASDERNVLKIDQHLAMLATLNIDATPFERRATEISREESASRRALLADSLVVDLANALKAGREREAAFAKLRERRIELSRMIAPQAKALLSSIDKAINTRNLAVSPDLIAQSETLIADYFRTMAAAARRHAVLKGLSSLGYEVTEGMATAWVENGRVVLRKTASPGYGVELGGGVQSDRLQVRAVAFGGAGAARDARRDRDMETIWCSEFERLQAFVGKHGGALDIEKALPAGAKTLKVIEDVLSATPTEIDVPATRTLGS
jgi:hypothetical protein